MLTELNDLLAIGILYCSTLDELDDVLGIGICTFVYSLTKLDERRKVGLAVFLKILCKCVTEAIDLLTGDSLKLLCKLVVSLAFLVNSGVDLSRLCRVIASYGSLIAITESCDNLALVVHCGSKMSGLLIE